MKTSPSQFPYLAKINSPLDLRQLADSELNSVAKELREFIIDRLNHCGGHFAANLGAVELTLALHYIYNTPKDRIVWDVGHQAYPHKVLTGRADQLHTIKQPQGLAPFPKREESQYDSFDTGHSSTSISAALGMAIANQLDHQLNQHCIAVIGDGGLTGGMAFEALNHAGCLDPNLLIVLNDNDMSISKNVGALTHYFARILSGKVYSTLREGGKKVLAKMPPISKLAKRTETHIKGMIVPGTLFEELGINYFGPIDGHDISSLLKTLRIIKSLSGPKLLHVITRKGKGYPPAEADPIKYHAVKPGFYSPKPTNDKKNNSPKSPTYSEIFGQWLCDMAEQDSKLLAITPAMCEGSCMNAFAKQFPQRYFDVGIAEQHCVTLAAGLACEGKKPVVAIYSTFLQRAYDQLIHDVALQNLDVTFAIDRAGLVGPDGPTHAGSFDLSFMRCIPNLVIMAPSDENECRQMLYSAYQHPGPAAVRYPKGSGPKITVENTMQAIPIGSAQYRRHGQRIAILAFGSMVEPALVAGEQLNATVVNMRFIKPLDKNLVQEIANQHDLIVTVEENAILGGAGSAVSELLNQNNIRCSILQLGLPDEFIEHGNRPEQLAQLGLNSAGITASIKREYPCPTLDCLSE